MRMSLKICLVIAALLGSVSISLAMPKCPETVDHNNPIYMGLDECFGTGIYKAEVNRKLLYTIKNYRRISELDAAQE